MVEHDDDAGDDARGDVSRVARGGRPTEAAVLLD